MPLLTKQGDLTKLLKSVKQDSSKMKDLVDAINAQSYLKIDTKDLTAEDITHLGVALEQNTSLESLEVFCHVDNKKNNLALIKMLSKVLEKNSTLVKLDFGILPGTSDQGTGTRNKVAERLTSKHIKLLAPGLKKNKTLRFLGLGSHLLRDEGVELLLDALKKHPALDKLGLNDNEIGFVGAQTIAEFIENNPTLEYLLLGDNRMKYMGAQLIVETTLEKNKKLVHVDLGAYFRTFDPLTPQILKRFYAKLKQRKFEREVERHKAIQAEIRQNYPIDLAKIIEDYVGVQPLDAKIKKAAAKEVTFEPLYWWDKVYLWFANLFRGIKGIANFIRRGFSFKKADQDISLPKDSSQSSKTPAVHSETDQISSTIVPAPTQEIPAVETPTVQSDMEPPLILSKSVTEQPRESFITLFKTKNADPEVMELVRELHSRAMPNTPLPIADESEPSSPPITTLYAISTQTKQREAREIILEARRLIGEDLLALTPLPLMGFLTKQEKIHLKDQVEAILKLDSAHPDYNNRLAQLDQDLEQISTMNKPLESSLRALALELQNSASNLLSLAEQDKFRKQIVDLKQASKKLTAALAYEDLFKPKRPEKAHIKYAVFDMLRRVHRLRLEMPSAEGVPKENIPDEQTIETTRQDARKMIEENLGLLNYSDDQNTIALRMHLILLDAFSESPIDRDYEPELYLAIKEQMKMVEGLKQQLMSSVRL